MAKQKFSYRDVLALLENLDKPDKVEAFSERVPCLIENYEAFSPTRYIAMRRVIEDMNEVLRQENEQWTQIIHRRFITGEMLAQASINMHISERQFQNLQQNAVKRIAKILELQEERCCEGRPTSCGDQGIELSYRLPLIASAFGSYFAGLLLESNNFCYLDEQIECAPTFETKGLLPLSRIQYLLRKPKGPQILIVSGASGMGKTTFATKVLKCLFEEADADRILGGSAKTEYVDVITQEVRSIESDFSDPGSFYRRLYVQLGLPSAAEGRTARQLVGRIQQWLRDHNLRIVIALDNLDSLDMNSVQQLTQMLAPLLNRDCRAIITTRHLNMVPENAYNVILRPLNNTFQVLRFLQWHVNYYAGQQSGLAELDIDENKAQLLARKTEGLPLLMQLLLSSVLLAGWSYLDQDMPYGEALYNFLYRQHWDALGNTGQTGRAAQNLARFITDRQRSGRQTKWADLNRWGEIEGVANVRSHMNIMRECA